MNYLSVCSGIEAASVAWHPLNFRPIGFSEIETFPCSVLSHHFPEVPNFGDMNNFEEWDINGTVDILVGGTPCQSFSAAGLRKGLTDGRGNLALTYCRILQKFRPRWFVWENVPGVLSSHGGRDFGFILGAMVELGYGIAYRVLDAQYFGVPQRRRRVFVVGCFGNWRRAAEVLFEPGCVSGDFKKGRKSRKDIAGSLASRTSAGGGLGTDFDLASGLQVVGTLGSHHGNVRADQSWQGQLIPSTGQTSHCLNAGGMGRQDYETETMIACTLPASNGGVSSGYHPIVTAFSGRDRGDDGRGYNREPNVTGSITETIDSTKPPRVAGPTGVRRLTPRECLRLQGFPDDYLELKYGTETKAHAAQVLHELWKTANTFAREGWRSGVAASLLTPQILLAGVHGGWISWEMAERCASARRAISCEAVWSENFVRELRINSERRSSPYRRESFEQLERESQGLVPQLSYERAQAEAFLLNSRLWKAAQRTWPLRYALATPSQIASGKMNPDGPRCKAIGNSMAVPVMRWIGQRILQQHKSLTSPAGK